MRGGMSRIATTCDGTRAGPLSRSHRDIVRDTATRHAAELATSLAGSDLFRTATPSAEATIVTRSIVVVMIVLTSFKLERIEEIADGRPVGRYVRVARELHRVRQIVPAALRDRLQ